MPIEHRTPPTGGTAEIEAHLHAILAGPADAVHRPSEGWEQIHLAQPHPTFHMGLQPLVAGAGLDAAEDAGWRYVVFSGETPVGFAFLGHDADGGPRFDGYTSGPAAADTIRVLVAAEAHELAERQPVELRCLVIGALHVNLLWLRGADDHLFAVHDVEGLRAGEAYTWAEARDALRARAQAALDREHLL